MTLQTTPIVVGDGLVDGDGNALRDLPFLGLANTELPVFRLHETLDRVGFQLEFIWLQLSDVWLVRELLTRDGTVVTLGIPLTSSGVDLLRPTRRKAGAPDGQLWLAFDDGRTGPPRREDWRGTAHLYYRPDALADALEGTDRELF